MVEPHGKRIIIRQYAVSHGKCEKTQCLMGKW